MYSAHGNTLYVDGGIKQGSLYSGGKHMRFAISRGVKKRSLHKRSKSTGFSSNSPTRFIRSIRTCKRKGYVDMQRETNYYMHYSEDPGYPRGLESGFSVMSIRDKD